MAGIKTILAGVDPRVSEHFAIERAHQLAVASGASVCMLLSDYQESLTEGILMDNEKIRNAREEYIGKLRDWLDKRAKALSDDGIEVTTEVVWHSPRYESLLSKADELGADMIVRAARKHSKIDRLLFAATDWELIRRAPQPVWVVKKKLDPGSDGLKVLAAVDPAHPEEKKAGLDNKLLGTADSIVKLFGGTLHAFHAYNPSAAMAPVASAGHHAAMPVLTIGTELMEELQKYREKQIHKLVQPFGIPDSNVHLVAGDTEEALNEIVEELDIDVVVAGAVSRGRLERLLIGSTAEAILDAVHCDVVVIKPDGFPR